MSETKQEYNVQTVGKPQCPRPEKFPPYMPWWAVDGDEYMVGLFYDVKPKLYDSYWGVTENDDSRRESEHNAHNVTDWAQSLTHVDTARQLWDEYDASQNSSPPVATVFVTPSTPAIPKLRHTKFHRLADKIETARGDGEIDAYFDALQEMRKLVNKAQAELMADTS